jgi:hypothetical protein
MAAAAIRAVGRLGLNNTMFNVEFIGEHIIEVNARMCYQFADLYEKVDGINGYEIQTALACGERPAFRRGAGEFGVAASFPLLVFEDHRLVRIPDSAALRGEFPDLRLHTYGRVGHRLSDDEFYADGYRYAIINLGARDPDELMTRSDRVKARLGFQLEPVGRAGFWRRLRDLKPVALISAPR